VHEVVWWRGANWLTAHTAVVETLFDFTSTPATEERSAIACRLHQELAAILACFSFMEPHTAPRKTNGRPSLAEVNLRVRAFLINEPCATIREIHRATGYSTGAICKTPAWRAVVEQRRAGRTPKRLKAESLKTGVAAANQTLENLITEQAQDARRATIHKRV
jgi:hypothetical protein